MISILKDEVSSRLGWEDGEREFEGEVGKRTGNVARRGRISSWSTTRKIDVHVDGRRVLGHRGHHVGGRRGEQKHSMAHEHGRENGA